MAIISELVYIDLTARYLQTALNRQFSFNVSSVSNAAKFENRFANTVVALVIIYKVSKFRNVEDLEN